MMDVTWNSEVAQHGCVWEELTRGAARETSKTVDTLKARCQLIKERDRLRKFIVSGPLVQCPCCERVFVSGSDLAWHLQTKILVD